MLPVAPNPFLGVSFHGVGAMLAANCYAPQKYIRRWSWEIFWMTQAAWCWLLWPIIGAVCTIPQLGQVLAESPKQAMLLAFLMGMAYGVGGTAFNLAIRYIGFSLTYAIAVGLSSRAGHHRHAAGPGKDRRDPRRSTARAGCCRRGPRRAGHRPLRRRRTAQGTRLPRPARRCRASSLWSRACLSLLAGVLSAVYGIAIEDVAKPIIDMADQHGAGYWKGNIAYPFVNSGAFVTALLYSLFLARQNRSLGQLTRLAPGQRRQPRRQLSARHAHRHALVRAVLLLQPGPRADGQLRVHQLGHPHDHARAVQQPGGVLFREWKGCQDRTRTAITVALLVLLTSVVLISYGNYLGDTPRREVIGGRRLSQPSLGFLRPGTVRRLAKNRRQCSSASPRRPISSSVRARW